MIQKKYHVFIYKYYLSIIMKYLFEAIHSCYYDYSLFETLGSTPKTTKLSLRSAWATWGRRQESKKIGRQEGRYTGRQADINPR